MATAQKVLRREWTSAEGWRDTKAGMWAWLLQRGAALALVVAVVLHLRNPFVRAVQAFLFSMVLLHGLLGIRAILLDFGLPVRLHRAMFAGAIVLGVGILAGFWGWYW